MFFKYNTLYQNSQPIKGNLLKNMCIKDRPYSISAVIFFSKSETGMIKRPNAKFPAA